MKKTAIMLGFLAIAMLMTIGTAESAYTGTVQAISGMQCGSITVKGYTVALQDNTSFCYNSTAGSYTAIGAGTNSSDTNWSVSWDTSGASDTTYSIFMISNYTTLADCNGPFNASQAGGFPTDNTAPTTTYVLPTDGSTIGYGYNFSVTFDETVAQCNFTIGTQTYTGTGALTTACYYDFGAGAPPEKYYTWYVTASDNTTCTNSQAGSTQTVTVDDTRSSQTIENIIAVEDGQKVIAPPKPSIIQMIRNWFCSTLNIWC